MAILWTRGNQKKKFIFYLLSVFITFSMLTSGILILTHDAESNTGGPDTFGYRWIDSKGTVNITYNWTDGVTGGTNLFLGNQDNSGSIQLGFRFPFYSNSYSRIYICDNGWASFIHGSTTTSDTIPSQFAPNAVIAPFWTDLDPSMYPSSGNVYYKRMSTSTPKHFIITWDSVPISKSSSYNYNNTFQAIIYENGSVLFQYKAINTTLSSIPIVGIENQNGNIGLQYSSVLTNKSAVMFYYNYPEHEIIVKDFEIPLIGIVNEYVQIGATIQNFGINDETNINVTLKINNVAVNWTLIDIVYFSEKYVSFKWRPTTSNNYSVEIEAKQIPGETNPNNNKLNRNLDVRNWRLVMLDNSQGEWMDWGYFSNWFTELMKYNFYVEEHHSGTIDSNLLSRYEIVIFPTPTNSFTTQELTDIHNFVTTGHGLLVFGYYDYYTNIYDSLTQPYEITWQNYNWGSGTTTRINSHEITNGVSSVYINTARNELLITGSATALVWDTTVTPNGIMLAISNESSQGRVAAYTDPYGFVDWSITRANNKILAIQIMEWVAGDTKPPARPSNFKVANGKVGNQLNLSWNPNTEIDLTGYYIYRRPESGSYGGTPVAIVPAGTNSYHDTNLQDHTKYYYQMAAVDEIPNISPLSIELSGTPTDIIAPKSPANFTIKDAGTGFALNISWNHNLENDLVAYHIYKSESEDGPFTEPTYVISPDSTYYLDTDVMEGEMYYYTMSAVDEVPNESKFTYVIGATPYDKLAPSQPSNFNVSDPGIGNTLILTWSPNTEADLIDYLIERKDNRGTIKRYKVVAPETSFTDTDLEDGKPYEYQLFARDDTKLALPNKSPPTPWVIGIPTDITPPGIPQNLSIIDESYSTEVEQVHCLNLTWDIGNDTDLRGYRIYKFTVSSYELNEDKLLVELGVVDHYRDYNVAQGDKFYYKITAFDEVPNESPPGVTLKGVPKDVTPPPIPKGFRAEPEPEGNTVRLTWQLQSEEEGGYRLFYSKNQTGEFELVENFTYNINDFEHTDLIDDQIYYYKLQAFDGMPNYSPFTPIISVIPSDIQPPNPPKGLRIVTLEAGNSLQLSWRANEDEDLSGYRVYRRSEDMPYSMVMAVDKNSTTVVDEFLINDKKYRYYITALDEVPNESEGSVERDALPKDNIAPEPVPEVNIELGSGKDNIILSWTQSSSPDAETYRIFRSTDGKNFKKLIDVPFTDTSYTDTYVEQGRKYYYQVSAMDDVPNISPRSKTVSIEVPTAETSLNISLISTSILGIVIIVIILLIILLLVRKRKKKLESKAEEKQKPEQTETQALAQAQAQLSVESLPMAIPSGAQSTPTFTPGQITPVAPTHSPPASLPAYSPETKIPTTGSRMLAPAPTVQRPEEQKPVKTEPIKTATPELSMKPDAQPPTFPSPKELEAAVEGPEVKGKEGVGLVGAPTQEQTKTGPTPTTPGPTPMTQPTHIRPVIPGTLTPPPKKLPTILIPLDQYGRELIPVSQKKDKKESITFLNPELYTVPRRRLSQPPVGKVVKRKTPEPKSSTNEKPQKTKPNKGSKEPEEKKTSEDEIKKLLSEYMK